MVDIAQLRLLPSINELLQTAVGQQLVAHFSHVQTVRAIRASLAQPVPTSVRVHVVLRMQNCLRELGHCFSLSSSLICVL
jgi:hypothetical protein